jgi:AdoMet-dependent heme synthase
MMDVWWSRKLNRAPRCLPVLHLLVTDKCNLRCRACGVCDYSPGDHGMLTTAEWKNVIQSATRLHTTIISISGGEPLLRGDLAEIVGFASDKGIAVHLNSNGTLLTDTCVDALRGARLATLSISLDGARAEEHDAIRGPGAFERAVEGIRLVRAKAPSVRIGLNFLITRANFEAMTTMVQFAEELDVHQIKFMPIHTNLLHRDKPLDEYEDLVFSATQLPELEKALSTLQGLLDHSPLHTSSRSFFRGIPELYRGQRGNPQCYAGFATCAVTPQGWVTPCHNMDGVASVRDFPLEEIWRGDAFRKVRQKVKTCPEACWDTTHAEISLRFNARAMLGDLRQVWRDYRFYVGSEKR